MKSSTSKRPAYFCEEPWTGGFSIQTNLDVKFCSCYLNMKIGSLRESTIDEIWNSADMQRIRGSFHKGELPEVCKGQLCPVALGHGSGGPIGLTKADPRRARWKGADSLRQLVHRIGGIFR